MLTAQWGPVAHISNDFPQLWDLLQSLCQLVVRHKAAERLKVSDGDGHLRLVVGVLVYLQAFRNQNL